MLICPSRRMDVQSHLLPRRCFVVLATLLSGASEAAKGYPEASAPWRVAEPCEQVGYRLLVVGRQGRERGKRNQGILQ